MGIYPKASARDQRPHPPCLRCARTCAVGRRGMLGFSWDAAGAGAGGAVSVTTVSTGHLFSAA